MDQISHEQENIVRVEVSGTLTGEDYQKLIPAWEAAIARFGKIRLLFIMRDFHGWQPGAAWDDFRFDRQHGPNVQKVGMVGEKKWQEWISKLGALFAGTTVRYFDIADLDKAKRWIKES